MNYPYIIIDDVQESILKTKATADGFSELVFVASANNYSDGLNLVLEYNPKLIFLEINPTDTASNLSLALINELYRYLKVIPKIIITTNSKDLAFEAIQYDVADYILKPLKRIDLIKSILKIKKSIDEEEVAIVQNQFLSSPVEPKVEAPKPVNDFQQLPRQEIHILEENVIESISEEQKPTQIFQESPENEIPVLDPIEDILEAEVSEAPKPATDFQETLSNEIPVLDTIEEVVDVEVSEEQSVMNNYLDTPTEETQVLENKEEVLSTEVSEEPSVINNVQDTLPEETPDLDKTEDNLSFEVSDSDMTQAISKIEQPLVLCIKSYGDYRYIDATDICFFQADNNSTDIHLNNGEMVTAFKTLKHFEGVLPFPFSRIHNSYIVNRNYISRIHTGNAVCYIKNTTTKLPFSKSYKENVDLIISEFANGNYLEI